MHLYFYATHKTTSHLCKRVGSQTKSRLTGKF